MISAQPTVERMTVHQTATMTVTHAATVLGISRTTAYECVRRGQIPSIRLGGRIVVPRQAIEGLLAVGSGRATEATEDSSTPRQETSF